MKKLIVLLFVCLMTASIVFSQNLGINTGTPDNSDLLDLTLTQRGFLVPRVALDDVNTATPVIDPIAAKLCDDYTGGTQTNWYLPARNELNIFSVQNIINYRLDSDGNGLSVKLINNYYWSSAEHPTSDAWFRYFLWQSKLSQ